MVSELVTTMAPPTEAERLAQLEEKLETTHRSMRENIAVEVAAAIKSGVAAMQQTLIDHFSVSLEEVTKQQDDKMIEAMSRLEGRINRSKERQEAIISSMKDDQLQFQVDIRSTLTSLKI